MVSDLFFPLHPVCVLFIGMYECVRHMCASMAYVCTCTWRSEVDDNGHPPHSSLLFIQSVSLSQTHQYGSPIRLLLLASSQWDPLSPPSQARMTGSCYTQVNLHLCGQLMFDGSARLHSGKWQHLWQTGPGGTHIHMQSGFWFLAYTREKNQGGTGEIVLGWTTRCATVKAGIWNPRSPCKC